MKRISLLLVTCLMLFAGCGKKEAEVEIPVNKEVAVANPWTNVSKEDLLIGLGFDMTAPNGAIVTGYQINESEKIGQLTFKYGEPELEYIFRMKSTAEFEDISGMNYEWDVEDDASISWCEGKMKRAITEEETVNVCLWYDVVPGIMYSLTTSAPDLDGFDIEAIALLIFQPTQEEVDGEMFIPSNFLEAKLSKDTFDSFDEVIGELDKGNAYAKVKVYGYDEEILFIAEDTYDYGGGTRAAIEVSAYADSNGRVRCIGGLFSAGTAYPVSVDDEGKLYSGSGAEVSVSCISEENVTIMNLMLAYVSHNEDGSSTYGGFIRSANNFTGEEVMIAEDDSETLDRLFEEYQNTKPISFTVVE